MKEPTKTPLYLRSVTAALDRAALKQRTSVINFMKKGQLKDITKAS